MSGINTETLNGTITSKVNLTGVAVVPEWLKGDKGDKGDTGEPFTYEDFTPEQLVLLKGEKGDTGKTGATGEKGAAFTYSDFTPEQLAALKGADGHTPVKGIDYFDGKDGYTPVKNVDYFDGVNGRDGYTPIKGVDYFDGKDGEDGYTPVKGVDYFTPAEIAEFTTNISAASQVSFDDSVAATGATNVQGAIEALADEAVDSTTIQEMIDNTINDPKYAEPLLAMSRGYIVAGSFTGADMLNYYLIKGQVVRNTSSVSIYKSQLDALGLISSLIYSINSSGVASSVSMSTTYKTFSANTCFFLFNDSVGRILYYASTFTDMQKYFCSYFYDNSTSQLAATKLGKAIDEVVGRVKTLETSGGGSVDLTNYYTKTQTDAAITAAAPNLSGYALKTEIPNVSGKANSADLATIATSGDYADLANKPTIPTVVGLASETYVDTAIAEAQLGGEVDLSAYALKTEIPSTTGLASETYVNTQIAAINIPTVPTNVSAFTNDAGYLTQHQSLAGYATETFVNTQIAAITPPDLSGYALKTELPTMTNYYTKTEIDATIGDIATLLAAI